MATKKKEEKQVKSYNKEHFKMSKETKRMLATLDNPTERNLFAKAMVNAQITAETNERMAMMYDVKETK